ncbi:hypothetical protein SJI19_16880 [Acerihabitans sp. TG2]|uniref:hypothetical protein n=1 Tax=Acerihabitans sp. TG2 TaxID=3096008 RepID=UPI002B230448|nr:hypothetical protein [Acerihabitans sp. TG2]MEA9392201.1 hypothetical protein [Acerihabitans sp. TG2]
MTKKASLRSRVSAGVIISLASCVAYAYCPPQYQENTVAPAFQAAIASIKGSIVSMDASLSSILLMQSQRLSSAIAVMTKQKALSANQVSEATLNSTKMVAQGLNDISTAERLKKARFDYGGEFGQGYNPCKIMAGRNLIASRNADLSSELTKRVRTEIDSGPGKYASVVDARNVFTTRHQAYCTADEVASGMCKSEGTLPGADTNVATLFTPAMEGSDQYVAKNAFINNLAGIPDQPLPAASSKSADAQSYILDKNRRDALVSPALTALKDIQIDSSGIDGTETGKELPMSQLMDKEVKRYSGNSDGYTAWTRSLVSQNERGVIVEVLKVKSLELAQKARLYKQYEVMEAQLAALTALQAQAQVKQTEFSSQRAQTTTTQSVIQ